MNRVREEHSRYHREADGKRVIVVTHGEYMWTERLVNENMLPEEWVALDSDKSQRIRNCAVLHYSRANPDRPDDPIDDHLRWMRFVYTDAPEESPYGGDWIEIPRKRKFTTQETLAQLAMFPPLMRDIETPEPVEPRSPPR